MSAQLVIWTALPNGRSAKAGKPLQLSVLVSPRLITTSGSDGTLADFPDFQNWPAKVANIKFSVEFQGLPAITVSPVSAAPPSALWTALFKTSTRVHSYVFDDLTSRHIRSFPLKLVKAFLKQQYQIVATQSPADLPTLRFLGLYPGAAGVANFRAMAIDGNQARLAALLDPILAANKAVPAQALLGFGTQAVPMEFVEVRLFHQFLLKSPHVPGPLPTPQLDFHQAVSGLNKYPGLMRMLGLVFDLEIPLPSPLPASSKVRVTPLGLQLQAGSQNSPPWTQYVFIAAANVFQPAPGPGSLISNGMLALNLQDYEVVALDVDGAAVKAMDFAVSQERAGAHQSSDSPQQAGVPSLRSAGFSVALTDRAVRLVETLQRATDNNTLIQANPANTAAVFFAEDLVRGFRIDVLDSHTGQWHSLCRRDGTYTFLDTNTTVTISDEGVVSLGVTETTDQSSPSPDLRLHETLFQWPGWSLVAPRPGAAAGTALPPPPPPPPADLRLSTTFTPQNGSLPRLRFGWQYQLRIRAADLAGNSLPFSQPTPNLYSLPPQPIVYQRFEPVAAPMVVLRKALSPTDTPGESFERLVIRSNYNRAFAGPSERHLAPPKVSELMAETHGMFDTATGVDPNATNLVNKDGSFAPGAVHPEAQLLLPYLPDPISRGAALSGTNPGPALLTAWSGAGRPDGVVDRAGFAAGAARLAALPPADQGIRTAGRGRPEQPGPDDPVQPAGLCGRSAGIGLAARRFHGVIPLAGKAAPRSARSRSRNTPEQRAAMDPPR